MGKKRIVTHLTPKQYLKAKEREANAGNSAFTYNTRTCKVAVDMVKLVALVNSAPTREGSKVVKPGHEIINVNEL